MQVTTETTHTAHPLSTADFSSPYDLLKKENSDLKGALAVSRSATRTLDMQLLNRALINFIKADGRWEEFKRRNSHFQL